MSTRIYHITHVSNLRSIAQQGLFCDNGVNSAGVNAQSIAHSNIKADRAEMAVPLYPGGTLADYVPFYFAPRSPMLYTINQGNVPSVVDGQKSIVHLVLDAEAVAANQACIFTDGHAIMSLSNFYNDLRYLNRLDWTSINSRYWGSHYDPTDETKRKKQSEFLAHRHVQWNHVVEIGAPSQECVSAAHRALHGLPAIPRIFVQRDWYYYR